MTIKEAGINIVKTTLVKTSYIIGFLDGDETELDVRSLSELEELWKSLCPEFGGKEDDVDFIEKVNS